MSDPVAGLTELIAGHWTVHEIDDDGDWITCDCGERFATPREWAAHVAGVVQQHTTALNARAEAAEATVARVEAIIPRVIQGLGRKATYIDVGYASGQKKVWADLRAALEGEQQ
ncbi:hypothetical protein ABH922_003018 [Rhodococcus sp. 27YEA15]|uniref:hypothetical protein n=1 Tax=Rhodococcus sp. 27YEA15 TaxID=3156259 RepID=UPI003C7CDF24